MIAFFLALSIAAIAPGEPSPQASREGRALAFVAASECRTAMERAELGDFTWMERAMEANGLPEEKRAQWRALCLVYLQGRTDERADMRARADEAARRRP